MRKFLFSLVMLCGMCSMVCASSFEQGGPVDSIPNTPRTSVRFDISPNLNGNVMAARNQESLQGSDPIITNANIEEQIKEAFENPCNADQRIASKYRKWIKRILVPPIIG